MSEEEKFRGRGRKKLILEVIISQVIIAGYKSWSGSKNSQNRKFAEQIVFSPHDDDDDDFMITWLGLYKADKDYIYIHTHTLEDSGAGCTARQ